MAKDNSISVVSLLLERLGIPVTRWSIQDELHKHPDFPSLLSISDVLRNWNVPHTSYKLSFEELANVPAPFIAYMVDGFVVVEKCDDEQVMVSNERLNKLKIGVEGFKQLYRGVVLIAQWNRTSGEANYVKKRRKESLNKLRLPFVISTIFFFLIMYLLVNPPYVGSFGWSFVLIFFFKTIGIATSVMLLIQSIDASNPLIQKLCGRNEKGNCNEILSSKASKIVGSLSWAEIGFFYFAGTLLALLFNSYEDNFIPILALLNVITLPYTFYSVNYQWRIAKQWCRLCCTIQALLWLEFLSFLPYLSYKFEIPGAKEWFGFIIVMAVPLLSWIFIKPYLLQSKEIKTLILELRKFKYNNDLFNKMINREEQYNLLDEKYSIVIGEREARHTITIVSNPYCEPCSKAHNILNEWLSNRDDIRLQIVFITNDDKEDSKVKVVDHFMALRCKRDNLLLKRAMDDWYNQRRKDYEDWSKDYPTDGLCSDYITLVKQREWCDTLNIKVTPTILINGRKLPEPYRLEDIKYLI